MSSSKTNSFETYLQRIHRHWIFWRIVEFAGAGVGIACAFAFVLSLILFARGESSLILTLLCIAIGIVLGAIAGWLMRPSILRTASEIDHQFALADLIATALAIRQSQTFIADVDDQPWSQTILNIADARSVESATQSLLLRRWGVRGWSGIGLSAALVLTFGLLSTNPLISRANHPDADGHFDSMNTNQTQVAQSTPVLPQDNQPESLQKSQISATHEATDGGQSSISNQTQHENTADQSGKGEGTTIERPHQEQIAVGHSDASTNDSGTPASGGGNASASGHGRIASNAFASDQNAAKHDDRGTTNESSPQSQSGDQKFNASTVPDEYRDLVRDFFQHN